MFKRISFRLSPSIQVVCLTMNASGGAVGDALKKLGYKTYDIRSCFGSPNGKVHPVKWFPVLERRADLDPNLFTNYDAIVGLPASAAYEQTIQVVPEYAKFILIEEMDKKQFVQANAMNVGPLLELLNKIKSKSKIAGEWGAVFNALWPSHWVDNVDRAVEDLEEFERYVKTNVPAERLYVYRKGDGWEPLCHFLGREDPPDEPFPEDNDGGEIIRDINTRLLKAHNAAKAMSFMILIFTFLLIFPSVWRSDESSWVTAIKKFQAEAAEAAEAKKRQQIEEELAKRPKLSDAHTEAKLKSIDMDETVEGAANKKAD